MLENDRSRPIGISSAALDGDSRRDPGAGWRTIHLAIGKHAHVRGRPLRPRVVAVGEDRPVKEVEIGIVGM